MADAQIRAVITAKDEASSVVSNFGSAIGKAVVPVGLMTGALVGFGVQAVKAFAESDAVARQLDAVLQSTAGAAGVTKDAALNLSKELEHLNGISDETALNAENVLLTFTKVGQDIFPQATQAAIDMATALNHGMVPSMEDVQTKTVLLGKALQDPDAGLGALKRVGVNVDELKKKFTEGMTVQDKQKLILQELATEFGGAGKAAGESFGGQIAKLKENFDDLMEVIGKAIVDTLKPLLEKIGPIVEQIRIWAEKNPALAKTITTVAIAVAGLGAAFVFLAAAGAVVNAVFSPFVIIAFAVIAAVGLIAWGVKALIDHFGGVEAIMKRIQPTIKMFSDMWNDSVAPAIEWVSSVIKNDLMPAMARLGDSVGPDLIVFLQGLATGLGILVVGAAYVLTGVVGGLIWVFSKLADVIAVANDLLGIHGADLLADQEANRILTEAVDTSTTARERLTQALKDEKQATEDLKNFQLSLEGSQLALESSQIRYNEAVAKYGPQSLEARTAAFNLKEATLRVDDAQLKVADSAGKVVAKQTEVKDATNKVTDAQQRLTDIYWLNRNALASLTDYGKEYMRTLDGISRFSAPDFKVDVTAGIGGNPSMGSPYYRARAIGGPVTSTESYMVGEDGPEMFTPNSSGSIVPNNKLSSENKGNSTINITVQAGAFMGSQQDARSYAMVIAGALKDIASSRAMTVGELLV